MTSTRGGGPPPTTNIHWESGDPRDDINPDVVVDALDGGVVQLRLSPLAATRLVMALGVGTAGHAKEVADILTGLVTLTTGVGPGRDRETRGGHLAPKQSAPMLDDAPIWEAIERVEGTMEVALARLDRLEARK